MSHLAHQFTLQGSLQCFCVLNNILSAVGIYLMVTGASLNNEQTGGCLEVEVNTIGYRPVSVLFTCTPLTEMAKPDAIYPWICYKGYTFWRTPPMARNIEEHLRSIKKINSRDDDILLCTFPKTGTHWLHEIISMLLSQTTEYNTKGNLIERHLEYKDTDDIEAIQGQRLLHSHLPISLLPAKHFEKQRKTIYINRNPKDRHVSYYHFLRGKAGIPDWTWSDYFNQEILPDIYLTGWFNYTKEMTAAVNNEDINIIQILYEDLLLDPNTQITRLAKYLEVPYTEEFICDVAKKCKFDYLKDHKIDAGQQFDDDGKSRLFRKGVIGDWKNLFTVAQNEQFDAIYREKMANVDVQFTFEPR